MYKLEEHSLISFEIGPECNLKNDHKKCPINKRVYNKQFGEMTVEDIVKYIEEARQLGFRGAVGFNHYNEPLIYKDRM